MERHSQLLDLSYDLSMQSFCRCNVAQLLITIKLFNLIAQQDNSVNLRMSRLQTDIAGASKRDSSAMKIIAILTTLFLPGTFVSVS
jgi:hypothetical protein